jgi:hypothetical protein
MKYEQTQRGYTLLFAILTATLVLGVTVFILSVSRKQFMLSATARDSMSAYYAADSGIECMVLVVASLDIENSSTFPCSRNNGLEIDGQAALPEIDIPAGEELGTGEIPSGFDVSDLAANPVRRSPPAGEKIYIPLRREDGEVYACARITIYQGIDENNGNQRTVVQSRGYNLCDDLNDGPDADSPRTLERAIQWVSN